MKFIFVLGEYESIRDVQLVSIHNNIVQNFATAMHELQFERNCERVIGTTDSHLLTLAKCLSVLNRRFEETLLVLQSISTKLSVITDGQKKQ